MNKIVIGLLICFFIGSCKTFKSVQYKPKNGYGLGYSHTQLSTDVFCVRFKSDINSNERADDFALLRCAEIALEHKQNYFVVISKNKTSFEDNSMIVNNEANSQVVNSSLYEAEFIVKLLNQKSDKYKLILDANFVTKNIKEKYRMDK